MIILYDANCSDFNNNGIGILRDTTKCEISEALNGELVLDMEYPITSKYINDIVNENIIKCDAGLEEEQLFRIKNVQPNLDNIIIYAEHITYDLTDNFLEDTFPQNLSGIASLDWILSHTTDKHKFVGFSDIQTISSARYVRKNPIEAIIGDIDNSFVKVWGGELERNNFQIKMLTRRGKNKGYKIKYRKNLIGLEFDIDNTNIITRIMPQGYNGLFLPEKYIESDLILNYPHPKTQVIEFPNVKVKEKEDDEEGFDTAEEAYEELRRLSNLKFTEENIDKPSINIKVEFIELSKTTEYSKYSFLEGVLIGDSVIVELDYTTVEVRVIKTIYDSLLHRYTSLELGEFKENYISDSQKEISNTVKKETSDISTTILSQAQESATEALVNAMGGNIYKTRQELFIMDSDNPDTCKKVWRFNINGWGYSSSGINGPYQIAATMDGSIVASMIKTGVLSADRIRGGTLILGGNNNYSGIFSLQNELAEELIRMDNRGIVLANGARLIGGNGVLSNFQFPGDTFNDWLGYDPNNQEGQINKTQIKIEAFIPQNFVITEAYVTLKHAPVYWHSDMANKDIWGYARNIKLYKVTDLNYVRDAYLYSEYYSTNLSSLVEITNAYGANGFTAEVPSTSNHKLQTINSSNIKNYLTSGNNMLVIQTANPPPAYVGDFIEENAAKQTGQGEVILNIIGYIK